MNAHNIYIPPYMEGKKWCEERNHSPRKLAHGRVWCTTAHTLSLILGGFAVHNERPPRPQSGDDGARTAGGHPSRTPPAPGTPSHACDAQFQHAGQDTSRRRTDVARAHANRADLLGLTLDYEVSRDASNNGAQRRRWRRAPRECSQPCPGVERASKGGRVGEGAPSGCMGSQGVIRRA